MMRLLLLLGLMLGLLNAESRYALLMGNSEYSKNKLLNPTHDVDLLEKKLTKLGFTVIKKKNLKNSEMLSELRNFYTKINRDTIAIIYFSGHGVNSTIDHHNYLMPIGSFKNLLNEADLPNEAISDSKLLASTAGAKLSILLLDACRSHDFAQVRGTKGLGQPLGELKNDYVISYATEIGKTANDGDYNSPYAKALAKYLSSAYSIGDIFTKIRAEVSKKTNGNQKPYYNPHFESIIYLSSQKEDKEQVKQEKLIIKEVGFLPKNPAFPHGKGITRKEGKCNEKDNGCARGLPFASFNNYIDSGSGIGINDERKFLVVQNQTTASNFTNSISAKVNEQIYLRAYIHNNGYCEDSKYIAHNTTLKISGFSSIGNGIYETEAKTSISIRQFITSSTATPLSISDDVLVTSTTGKKIKLQFRPNISILKTTRKNETINPREFFSSGGVNVGNIKGCIESSFYTQLTLYVVDGESSAYDLEINKTVNNGKSKETAKVGDTLKYRLYIKNKNKSIGTPSNISIYDNYDETKLSIVESSLSKACKDNGSVITCHIPNSTDTSPGKSMHTTYSATIKKGATGTILNTAEVRPNPDYDTYQGNDRDSVVVTIKE